MSAAGERIRQIDGKTRREVIARAHEPVALLLAASMLVSAGDRLRALHLGVWARPLYPAATLAVAVAIAVWIFPDLPAALHRFLVWGALSLSTPTALATMTAIDFSVLLACQLLLIAAVVPEVAQKRRVVLFLWLVPLFTFVTVVGYVHSFMEYRPL